MMFKQIFQYIIQAFRQYRVILLVYFLQLFLIGTFAIYFKNFLTSAMGKSLDIKKLLVTYDHIAVQEFLKLHGTEVSDYLQNIPLLFFGWIVISSFLHAGMWKMSKSKDILRIKTYIHYCIQWFWPLFKVTLVFLCMSIGSILVLLLPIILNLESLLTKTYTEKYTILLLIFNFLLVLIMQAGLFIWNSLSKKVIIEQQVSTIHAIKFGWKLLRRNPFQYWKWLGIFLIITILAWGFIWCIKPIVPASTAIGILLFFSDSTMHHRV